MVRSRRFGVPRERLIAVSRGGSAAALVCVVCRTIATTRCPSSRPTSSSVKTSIAAGRLGEQKQVAATPLDDEIVAFVRKAEGRDVSVLHPSMMYRLFAPYWWGHQPLEWLRQYTRFEPACSLPRCRVELPAGYTAVKFYFNDCFTDTPENRAFVERTVRELCGRRTGHLALDRRRRGRPRSLRARHRGDAGIRHLLTPDNNLLVQSAIVAGARRFVGTYGGFAYLAPLCGVPAVSYYSEPGVVFDAAPGSHPRRAPCGGST